MFCVQNAELLHFKAGGIVICTVIRVYDAYSIPFIQLDVM